MRRIRRELLRKALNKEVQRATAVVTNPTHYAVAIEYRPATMVAPVVVAKGRNLLAKRIKELARWHEVPIVENPPLAQALYKATDVGQMIPPKLYAAVAEILAFLYREQKRKMSEENMQKKGSSAEWLVPVAAVATVFVMLVPVPAFILDLFLATSVTLGVVVLLSALYILRPVQFSVFPTLLLFLTLFRISLNIAS